MKYSWLSHVLSQSTPAYAGGASIATQAIKSISEGDSCNQVSMTLSNHIGTHVDVPRHFIDDGKTIDEYAASDWVFDFPLLIDIDVKPGGMVDANRINDHCAHSSDVDLLLIRTHFEKFRSSDVYWKSSPVFNSDLMDVFEKCFPNLKAIALDTISLSSLENRDMGRECHRVLLGNGIRIFEDVALSKFNDDMKKIIALPLCIEGIDGAPVSMMGCY